MAGGMMGSAGFGLPALLWTMLALALLILAVVAIIWLALRVRRDDPPHVGPGADPLSELGRRYARGDIDRDTYLQMRRDLQGQ